MIFYQLHPTQKPERPGMKTNYWEPSETDLIIQKCDELLRLNTPEKHRTLFYELFKRVRKAERELKELKAIPPRLFPHPTCQDCNGTGVLDGSDCPCLSSDPHESVCPKCGSVMGMVTMGEWRCFGKGCWK